MTLLDLVFPGSGRDRAVLVATATGSGLASAFALVTVNDVAQVPGGATLGSLLAVAALVVTALLGARRTAHRMIGAIEASLHRLKARITAKIQRAELDRIERIGTSEIFDRISENLALISLAASQLGSVLQSACVFGFSLLYLAWLSPSAFVLVLPLQLGAIWIYRSRQARVERLIRDNLRLRVGFFDRLMDLLRGAKELKLNRARARDALEHYGETSRAVQDVSTRVNHIWDDNILFMTCNLYVLLAALVFVYPKLVEVDAETLAKLVVAVLFSWGSVQGALVGYSMYVEANEALGQIEVLERKLEGRAVPEPDSDDLDSGELESDDSIDSIDSIELAGPADPNLLADWVELADADELVDPWAGRSGRLVAKGVEHAYPGSHGEPGFSIGPIDLAIEPGEIVFIVGGNGSGKSTLLKVLTGLYPPTRGSLELAGVPVWHSVTAYRERICAIFSDYHLFSRPYGLSDPDPAVVRALLEQLEIEHKTAFVDGRFTRRHDLSSGQRKRLAMVLALLEDRPILVLDEWAADQDPRFRRYFYEQFLPSLQQRGKTVIAVSHDDRWFHCADRVLVMDYGQIRPS